MNNQSQMEQQKKEEFTNLLAELNKNHKNDVKADPKYKEHITNFAKLLSDQNSSQEFKEFLMARLFEIKANPTLFSSLGYSEEEDEAVRQIIMSQI